MSWLRRVLLLLGLMCCLAVAVPPAADGRVGGGQSWGGGGGDDSKRGGGSGGGGGGSSGGSSTTSSDSGGSDASGDAAILILIVYLVVLWILFCWEHPQIGLPITAAVVGGYFAVRWWNARERASRHLVARRREPREPAPLRSAPTSAPPALAPPPPSTRPADDPRRYRRTRPMRVAPGSGLVGPFGSLPRSDPAFSRVVLLDFLTHLFLRCEQARSEADVELLRPYLSSSMRRRLTHAVRGRVPGEVGAEDVVIGSVAILSAFPERGRVKLRVGFEYNLTLGGEPYYAREVWTLERDRRAESPAPERARSLGCPSCGAPFDRHQGDQCGYCETVVTPGRFGWCLVEVEDERRAPRRVYPLHQGVEHATDRVDVVRADFDQREAALLDRDPSFAWEPFLAFVEAVFRKLQAAWSAQSWRDARPYETDLLYHAHRFFLEAYQARGLHNTFEAAAVGPLVPVAVETDRYYEAITVRVFAEGLEYTVDAAGRVVEGSREEPRRFSEYWTFVRRAGSTRGPHSVDACPNCGAPVTVNQAGECEHCEATVTTGDFGWVLALIEQDDVYAG